MRRKRAGKEVRMDETIKEFAENEMTNPPVQIEQKEGIKLIKNTKGYGWEIKILSLDIDLLEKLNTDMKTRFGGKTE
jgi:hypothetical protein